jgi:hypothetical protein
MASEPGNTRSLRLLPEDEELKRRYLLWCEHTWGGGDCLRLLVDKPFLDGDARYALAMAIAHSKVLGAMKEELARMVNPQAVVATVVGGLTMYALLLALPEPVSKGIAALMTLGAMTYLGWDTVWRLIDGWLVLMKEMDEATTFDGISASGEKFGATMGEKAARAFVMLGTVALGNTASGMAATLPKLPGAGQAAVVAETQLNIRFTAPALAQVESVAITVEGDAKWVDKDLNFIEFFEGRNQMLDQAKRQFKAAQGTPIRWIVAEEKLAGALRKMFKEARLPIEVVHVSPAPRGGAVQ